MKPVIKDIGSPEVKRNYVADSGEVVLEKIRSRPVFPKNRK